MPKRKIKKGELTRPDEFETAGFKAIQKIGAEWAKVEANPKGAAVIAVSTVVVLSLVFGLRAWLGGRRERAREELSVALLDLRRIRVDLAVGKPESGKEWIAKSSDVQRKLETLVSRSGTPSDTRAHAYYLLGNISLRQGDIQKALEWLERFDASAPADHRLRPAAWISLGYVYEARGDANRALEYFRRGAAVGGPGASDAALGVARSLLALGRKEDSRGAYEDFLTKYPQSPGEPVARAQLSGLGSSGPAVPPDGSGS